MLVTMMYPSNDTKELVTLLHCAIAEARSDNFPHTEEALLELLKSVVEDENLTMNEARVSVSSNIYL